MSALKVTPDQLTSLSTGVARVAAQGRADQAALRNQLAPVVGAEWSGAAAAQFGSLYEQFDQHARGLADALDGIGHLLAQAGRTYAEAEASIAASFR